MGIQNRAEEYFANYKKDNRLLRNPHKKYSDFPGWKVFLGGIDFYPTWQEASKAAQALGIKSQNEYGKRYKEDARLPASPNSFYSDFPGLQVFLGTTKEIYPSWQEASMATIALGIPNSVEYVLRYKEDPMLPSDPKERYKDFPGFETFLRMPKKYASWQQAAKSARSLKISTHTEYKRRYVEDPRLLLHAEYLLNFPGWKKFLAQKPKKQYRTWQEASRATRRLGISGSFEYRSAYKKDSLLPVHPERAYPNFPGWLKFLGKID